ncbi:hypothetical protein SAMN04487897_1557 [Paenibacillus sp. yr247]|uniref:hypothetical protein n=1 Tax=Paenibacillus sp. yr247 TaxID=1761880 RepID=UPI000880D806|nr:hypothetical protein [Paenibacillus sp. yr247]SDP24625.1 hypothetical protein SAMN04487897_1557 [Paenibacillus sp. yr247]
MTKRKSTTPKGRKNSSVVVPGTEETKEIKISSTTGSPNHTRATGAYSNSAIAMMPSGQSVPTSKQEQTLGIKIARAMLSGPRHITKDATVVELDAAGNLIILRQGTNDWICFPGDENQIGNPPMCADHMGLQWMMDIMAKKPRPTNTAPGIIYMLCGATQHSNTDPFDRSSPAIPVGPHWMIIWPFDAKKCGLPNTIRDAGAWVMFDGTPYAYLHICGTLWVGNIYNEKNPGDQVPIWTMVYGSRSEP